MCRDSFLIIKGDNISKSRAYHSVRAAKNELAHILLIGWNT